MLSCTSNLAAALFTSVVALGLSHAIAQTAPAPANPGAMPADAHHHGRIGPWGHGKARIGSTYLNLGSDGDQWILSPTKDGRIIVTHVPPREPVAGQLQRTPAPGPQWQQVPAAMPRDVRCFNKPKLEDNCNGYGHARM
jgi:hypothetical protein